MVPQAVPVLRFRSRGRHARARGYLAAILRELDRAGAAFRGRAGLDLSRRRHAVAVASPTASRARSRRSASATDARRAGDHARGQPDRLRRREPRGVARRGINRISIGVQSLEPRRARRARSRSSVRRRHRRRSSACSRAGGFTTSARLHPRHADRRRRAQIRVDRPTRRVDHLSVYELTIEERTAFGQRVRDGRLVPLDEDSLTDLYIATHDALTRGGVRALRDQLATRGRASAPCTTRCTGAARRSSGSASAPRRLGRTRRQRRANDQPAPRGRLPRGARRAGGAYARSAPPRWPPTARGSGCGPPTASPRRTCARRSTRFLVDEGLAERRDGRICPTLRGFLMADRIAARIVQAL